MVVLKEIGSQKMFWGKILFTFIFNHRGKAVIGFILV
jgi:hypothetical protein